MKPRHHLSAVAAEAVEGACFYQGFDDMLAGRSGVNGFTKVKKAFKPADFFTYGDNLLDRLFADTFDGGKSEPYYTLF